MLQLRLIISDVHFSLPVKSDPSLRPSDLSTCVGVLDYFLHLQHPRELKCLAEEEGEPEPPIENNTHIEHIYSPGPDRATDNILYKKLRLT